MYTTRNQGQDRRNRAASEIVGLILLFGIVIAGAGILFWAGMDARDTVQTQAEIDTAETTLQEASSKLSTLSFEGDGATASFDLSGKDSNDVEVVRDGTISFQLNGKAACSADLGLGSIIYENDDGTTVAYQAGGVWKNTDGGTSIVQAPDLSYNTEQIDDREVRTMRFPVINVSGDVSASGTVSATASQSSNGIQDELCLTGPNADEIDYVREVKITIEGSTYYEGWERYFRDEFGSAGTITVDDSNQKVTVIAPLGSGVHPSQFPIENEQIFGAIFSGSSAGELDLQTPNTGINSYDSADGPWASYPNYGENGTIVTRGDVKVHAQSQIEGNLFAEGEVNLDSSCSGGGSGYCVEGDVYVNNSTASGPPGTSLYPTTYSQRDDAINGSWGNGTVVPEIPIMDDKIEDVLSTAQEYNNNNDTATVSSDQIQFTGGTAELDSGVYYLDHLSVASGNTLELNTTNGDIVLAIEGDVELGEDATVNVTGPYQVRGFINEDTTSGDQVVVDKGVTVKVSDGADRTFDSERFFLTCKAGCSASFEDANGGSPTQFTGVIYGPGEESDDGTISLGKDVDVWGALVAGTVEFTSQQANFHFDTSLKNDALDEDGDGIPDSVDDDSGFPDGDDDGYSDSEDDCPDVAGTGENGCAGVTENETANELIVNQSSATITILGSQIADEQMVNTTTNTRAPLNIELVIDDSGSMNLYENNYPDYDDDNHWYALQENSDYISGAHKTATYGPWSTWEGVPQASYIDQNEWNQVPSGEQWEVRTQEWVWTYPGWEKQTVVNTYDAGEWVDHPESSDDVRRRVKATNTITVPDGVAYVGDHNGDNSYPDDPTVYYPGESFTSADHDYYHVVDIDGNDPYWKRLDAAKAFVGAMNDSVDRIGLIEFSWYNSDIIHHNTQTSNFGAVNNSLARSNWESRGGTNILDSMDMAIDTLESSPDQRDGMNVTKTMVLMTDGKHSEDDEIEDIKDKADEAHAAGIRIYVVSLGDNTDESLLDYIANTDNPETDGAVYQVDDTGNLTDTFRQVANDTKQNKVRVIQHKNTSTTIHMGGDSVTFGSGANVNDPNATYPNYTVSSNLDVGDAVHFTSSTMQCGEDDTFDTIYNSTYDETFNETTCDGTNGMANQTTNSDHSAHQIFTDGDAVPSVAASAWYKSGSLTQIVNDYNSSLISGGTFDLPKNDAIILVNISDGEAGDTDYMVMYFDAHNQPPPDKENQTVTLPSDNDDTATSDPDTENGYVIDVPTGDVNVSDDNPMIEPVTPGAVRNTHALSRPAPTDIGGSSGVQHARDAPLAVDTATIGLIPV